MQIKTASILGILLFLSNFYCLGQKISTEYVPALYVQPPVHRDIYQYKTYSIDVDLGSGTSAAPTSGITLPGLKQVKENNDLIVKVVARDLKNPNKTTESVTYNDGSTMYYYNMEMSGKYGYEVVRASDGAVIAQNVKELDNVKTPSFPNKADLVKYFNNTYSKGLSYAFTKEAITLINNELAETPLECEFQLGYVKTESPLGQKTLKAFEQAKAGLMANKAAGQMKENEDLKNAIATWEELLAKADFKNSKAEINKKVADQLMENLALTYLFTGRYKDAKAMNDRYSALHSGALSSKIQFRLIDVNKYTGKTGPFTSILGKSYAPVFYNVMLPEQENRY